MPSWCENCSMGCTYSRSNGRRDPSIPSFKVHNVDVQGVELNQGRIEIRDGDLVFYQKGKDEIRWPLRWLRRYGYEQELFSFESGRRCATGNGIYAFKCSDAEALFNLVREAIERAGQDDQRAQQYQQQQQQQQIQQQRMMSHSSGTRSNRFPQHNTVTQPVPATDDSFLPQTNVAASQNGSAMHYVNESLLDVNRDHEYINTGPPRSVSAAFQIDETAALVDFLHNPPSFGRGGQTQLNYAEIETVDAAPTSMENLLDRTGQGAIHNVPRRGSNRLSQPSLASGGGRHDSTRFSMPNDLVSATTALPDSDSLLQTSDSDVFLDGGAGGGDNSFVCSNYVNVSVDESGGGDGGAGDDGGAGGGSVPPARSSSISGPAVSPPFNLMLPPFQSSEMNYANLAFDQQQPKPISEVNYIIIDHNAQSTNEGGAGGGVGGGGAASGSGVGGACTSGGNTATSPMSSTGCMPLPDSPSRKTRSYAKIDFDRTQALSNTARAQDDREEGSRKTRHNSSIGDMP